MQDQENQEPLLNIQIGLDAFLRTKQKTFPQHVNRISSIGHECERYLYYARVAWDKKAPVELSLQGIFETGHELERVIEKSLMDIGNECTPKFRIVGSQTTTNDKLLKQYQISGSIDGFLQIQLSNGDWVTFGVIDIKTSNPNIFARIENKASLEQYSWTKKYIAQLMLYSFAHDLEDCYILFVNKSNLFEMKLIHFKVDFDYVEQLLRKAERINKAVETEMPPKKLNIPRECGRCEFTSLCMPEIQIGADLGMCESQELIDTVERMQEILPVKKEYDSLERIFKGLANKGQNLIIGDYTLEWSSSERKAYEVKGATVWRKKIISNKAVED